MSAPENPPQAEGASQQGTPDAEPQVEALVEGFLVQPGRERRRQDQPPRTVAFGWNGEMTILDIKRMIDIERFRKINIRAQKPTEVYVGEDLAPENNLDFLKRCARWIPIVKFADFETGRIYAQLQRGKWAWRDERRFSEALNEHDAKAGLLAVAANVYDAANAVIEKPADVPKEKTHTLGTWAEAAAVA